MNPYLQEELEYVSLNFNTSATPLEMLNKFKPRSEFSRNVLTLMMGTVIAQAIPLAITPILTRLYSPEDFGIFALYIAIASITSVFATGRYEQAIMLPKKDIDAANIAILAILITCAISLLLLIMVFFLNKQISQLVERPEISPLLYLIPSSVFLTGVYQTLNYWNNRKKHYKILAVSRVFRSSSMSGLHLLAGFKTFGALGLIAGDIIGKLVSSGILLKHILKNDKKHFANLSGIKRKALAKRYKKFPTFDTGATLANVASYQVQSILFPIFYGLTAAGQYFLVLKVLQAPMSLISGAITDVYKQKLTSKDTTEEQIKLYYKKMFFLLFGIGIIPFSLFIFFAQDIFRIIFGSQWSQAGSYAAVLAPMFFVRFIASPLSYFLYLREKQEINILLQLLLFLAAIISIQMNSSSFNSVVAISISFSFIYISYILYAAALAYSHQKRF